LWLTGYFRIFVTAVTTVRTDSRSAITALHSLGWWVFVTLTECVYRALQTKYSYYEIVLHTANTTHYYGIIILTILWYYNNHHHLPPWIRLFDLFRHRRIAIVSWGVHGLFFLEVCRWGLISGVWCCPFFRGGWSSFVCINNNNNNNKVKWSRYRPSVAQRVGKGIALLFHDRGTRRGWVVSSTPRPHFTPGKDPVPFVQVAVWAPGPVWTRGKSRPQRDSIPDRPARSQSLYRLSYPAHNNNNNNNNNNNDGVRLLSLLQIAELEAKHQTESLCTISVNFAI